MEISNTLPMMTGLIERLEELQALSPADWESFGGLTAAHRLNEPAVGTIAVLDDFGGATAHGFDTSYVAELASISSNHNVDRIPADEMYFWPGVIESLTNTAYSLNPPDVVSLSFGYSPAAAARFQLKEQFAPLGMRYGADPAAWPADVREAFKAKAQLIAQRSVENYQYLEQGYGAEIRAAVSTLTERGTTVVVSAGNEGDIFKLFDSLGLEPPAGFATSVLYGADSPAGVIVVGASESNNLMETHAAHFTTPSAYVDLAADGTAVGVTSGERVDGTSFSAPQVAGLVADIRATYPTLTPAQIEAAVTRSARPVIGQEEALGAGIIDRQRAIEYAGYLARGAWISPLQSE